MPAIPVRDTCDEHQPVDQIRTSQRNVQPDDRAVTVPDHVRSTADDGF
jgi:hypothetical protein